MSQFYVNSAGSTPPPQVPTTFHTDVGDAVPVANILNVLGDDSRVNDPDGIFTAGSGNTVTVFLSNRIQGLNTTSGAVNADVFTFNLSATPGTYIFDIMVSAFDAVTPLGAGYSLFATFRSTGAAATLIQTVDRINQEEGALSAANATLVASGNSVILRVTGVTGLNLSWSGVGYYTFSS